PWMTERGTFVINGTERVVVTQLVRSPGAYLMEPKDREKQVFIANLMPARGSWLELEIDKKGKVFVRIDRKRKLPVTVLLRAASAERGHRQHAAQPAVIRRQALRPHVRGALQAQLAPRTRRRHRHAHADQGGHPGAGARARVPAEAPRRARGRRGRGQGLRRRGRRPAARAGGRAPRRVRALR